MSIPAEPSLFQYDVQVFNSEPCKSTKFLMNPMKDVGVQETRFLNCKAYVSMGNDSVKYSSINKRALRP